MTLQGARLPGYRTLCLLLVFFSGLTACAGSQSVVKTRLDTQRELFREAVQDAREARLDQAKAAIPSLEDYALLPYLELELIKAQIYDLSAADIDSYLNRYDDTVVGLLMKRAWLKKLENNREWDEFLAVANGAAPQGMRCEYITALRATGRSADADRETQDLWLTGNSLPDRCDTVFAQWLARLSADTAEEMHWQRAKLALQAGQSGLAVYLLRNISRTEHYQTLLSHPEQLYQNGINLEVNDFSRELVIHSLKALAAVDFERSNTLWHQLGHRFQFSPKQQFDLRDRFARELIAGGADYVRDWINANDRDFDDPYLTEWRVRLALKDQDWAASQQFINALPQKFRDKPDWQYWWAKADIEKHQRMTPEARAILQQLAAERGYYSFLAADLLNQDYQLGAKRTVKLELLEGVAQRQDVQRAKELYWHGLVRNANIEWRRATRSLGREEQVAAAQLALDWGWSHAAVSSAIRAGEWDDLELRFPLAFNDLFVRNAAAHNIELNWVYAIARQESAFAQHAQSRVGARGVMQLMPATARDISRDMGRPSPTIQDLHTAKNSIELGSFYLGKLVREFGGNHILATAAYNAGPERVKRVLARQKEAMPADIWIENLPYGETREYIKNVLAFSVVYGLKLPSCKSPSVQSGCNTRDEERYTVIGPVEFTAVDAASGS